MWTFLLQRPETETGLLHQIGPARHFRQESTPNPDYSCGLYDGPPSPSKSGDRLGGPLYRARFPRYDALRRNAMEGRSASGHDRKSLCRRTFRQEVWNKP